MRGGPVTRVRRDGSLRCETALPQTDRRHRRLDLGLQRRAASPRVGRGNRPEPAGPTDGGHREGRLVQAAGDPARPVRRPSEPAGLRERREDRRRRDRRDLDGQDHPAARAARERLRLRRHAVRGHDVDDVRQGLRQQRPDPPAARPQLRRRRPPLSRCGERQRQRSRALAFARGRRIDVRRESMDDRRHQYEQRHDRGAGKGLQQRGDPGD